MCVVYIMPELQTGKSLSARAGGEIKIKSNGGKHMKKYLALLLALVMVLSLCAMRQLSRMVMSKT